METKSKNIVALIIGRSGSSLPDKNVLPVLGQPLLHYTAAAALRSRFIGRFYISSDCPKILEAGAAAGYRPIPRPSGLSTATSQSADVVRHAARVIEAEGEADVLVVQHANVGTVTTEIIDTCIEELLSDPSLSAVVPVHEKSEYHPFRAKGVSAEGLLESFFDFSDNSPSGNRQDLPPAYFFDHSIWVLSVPRGVWATDGQPPWPCMGNRIRPVVTEGHFDVHSVEDLKRTEEWLRAHRIPVPDFSSTEVLSEQELAK